MDFNGLILSRVPFLSFLILAYVMAAAAVAQLAPLIKDGRETGASM